ncbi:unnamed protein product, partial [Symbiodinium necroappetens]
AEDIKVVRSSSMNYLALCATALSAAVLVRRSPPKSRPRVRIQACQNCATPSMQAKAGTTLPISIDSMDFLGSSEASPENGEAVTEVPPVILPADVGSFAEGAVVPVAQAQEKRRAGDHDGQRAKDRNYRRQVGSRLLPPLGAVPLALSFDPSRVRLKLQRAVQHRFATSATGREGKARSRSEGMDCDLSFLAIPVRQTSSHPARITDSCGFWPRNILLGVLQRNVGSLHHSDTPI